MKHLSLVALLLLYLGSGIAQSEESYQQEIIDFHSARLVAIRSPFGWASLVGLVPLNKPVSTIGATAGVDIQLPLHQGIEIGSVINTGSTYELHINDGVEILINGHPDSGIVPLHSDGRGNAPTLCQYKNVQWHIVRRQHSDFLRIRDTLSPYRMALDTIPYFTIDNRYSVKAKFIETAPSDTVRYLNELGQLYAVPAIGKLAFTLDGKEYQLSLLPDGEESYFVIVGDNTNGDSSYGGGRYLYPKKVDNNGFTILDFNYLINPPCIFTPYATCPLPPAENKLNVSIEAGEKYLQLY